MLSAAADDIEAGNARIDDEPKRKLHQRHLSVALTSKLATGRTPRAAEVDARMRTLLLNYAFIIRNIITGISNRRRRGRRCLSIGGSRDAARASSAAGLVLLLMFISFAHLASSSPLFYCHRLDVNPRRLYATKTSYSDVRSLQNGEEAAKDRGTQTKNTTHDEGSLTLHGCCQHALEFDGRHNNSLRNGLIHCHQSSQANREKDECEPVSVYLLARHGTRFNKLSNMDKMTAQLRRIRDLIMAHASKGTMCEEDLNWLNDWKPRHSLQDDSKLSDSGWNELLEIGRRYGDMFPEVLRRNYAPSLYEFRHTNYTGKGDRTRQSARAFAEGLWGASQNVEMIENPRPDWLLQFYEHCDKYLRVVSANPVEDYEKFKTGPEMTDVIRDVNKRLGLPLGTLGFDDVYLIFENCRLEHGLYSDAPWCSVLTPHMLEVIVYHQDIKYYWEDGYGHRISYEPACTLVRDILRHLQSDTKIGRFRFAHSGTLDSLYARIGLFEDGEALRFDNFDRHRSGRRWTTSRSTPMAANIAFIKYRCLETPTLRVKTLLNEDLRRPVVIPGCTSPLCPLETLSALWRSIADDCDIERICEQHQQYVMTKTTSDDVANGVASSSSSSSRNSDADLSAVL